MWILLTNRCLGEYLETGRPPDVCSSVSSPLHIVSMFSFPNRNGARKARKRDFTGKIKVADLQPGEIIDATELAPKRRRKNAPKESRINEFNMVVSIPGKTLIQPKPGPSYQRSRHINLVEEAADNEYSLLLDDNDPGYEDFFGSHSRPEAVDAANRLKNKGRYGRCKLKQDIRWSSEVLPALVPVYLLERAKTRNGSVPIPALLRSPCACEQIIDINVTLVRWNCELLYYTYALLHTEVPVTHRSRKYHSHRL